MKPSTSPEQVSSVPLADLDSDSLDALVSSSRRLGRFWPPLTSGPEPLGRASFEVSVPARTQRLVAGMPDYGG